MTILCYHSVDPHWQHRLAVNPGDFARHLAYLSRHRRVVPLAEATDRLGPDGRLPRGLAALTFDDGFAALHEHALPALSRLRLPATVFLVAQTLTPQGRAVDWVDRPPAHPLTTLSRDQVLEMAAAGVDFQSHSWAHHDLTRLGFAGCVRDLRDSREFLEQLLGRAVTLLAYPRGRHDEGVREAARRAGYTHAFTLPEGHEPIGPHAVPRVGVHRGNGVAALGVKSLPGYLPLRHSRAVQAIRRGRRGRTRHRG